MTIGNHRDFLAGLLYVVVGLGFAGLATTYSMGTVGRVGPGYFPFGLGLVLAAIGATVIIGAYKPEDEPAPVAGSLRNLVFVVAGVVSFGMLIRPAGLAISIAALVLVSSLASPGFSLTRAAILAAVLAGLSWLIFLFGLGLPIAFLPPFLGS